ncbi:hypothetical protein [Acinetobacter sp. ANC 3882]|uniref:hypothetical protein n=1 Tax=Acinetobacter sp. ANC 3882 TaxID=2923423 RepID=UPI001F4A283E|nr:hypothetical protein [Acinetobacter sp. ANC 3882]MCH7313885.1 hypothetical protein [Acinetobacter sp. ANC 3882]
MKENPLIMLFIVSSLVYSPNVLAKDQCHIQEVIDLSILKKNDYKFYNYTCESDSGLYLKSYIGSPKNKVFVGEYSDFAAKESPELLAVSVYKAKTKKPPLLITLNSASYCCTPQMEGRMYQVNLYQMRLPNSMILKNITNILGANAEGFDGKVEGRVHYNYKTIAEIKKWLDKNY